MSKGQQRKYGVYLEPLPGCAGGSYTAYAVFSTSPALAGELVQGLYKDTHRVVEALHIDKFRKKYPAEVVNQLY
jgi:hypothetical protein